MLQNGNPVFLWSSRIQCREPIQLRSSLPVHHPAGWRRKRRSVHDQLPRDGFHRQLVEGSFGINVDDDTPIATAGTSTGTVDEDGVVEGIADAGPGDGIAGGTGDVAGEATTATGSVAALFQSGADEPLSYGFAANAVTTLQALGLTSGGVALSYAVVRTR